MIYNSIEQRELRNPSRHIADYEYFAPTTTASVPFFSRHSYSELGEAVDAYIDKLVQDQFQLAYTQYKHTRHQQKHISNHPLHVNNTSNYAGLFTTLSKFLKSLTIPRMLTSCLLFWSLCSLVRYALLTEKALPTREAPLPLPFFGNESASIVEDYFRGNEADKSLLVSKAELTILMFYAPWSLDSMEARQPFLEVAAAFKDLGSPIIKFVAINCHDHRGQCRGMYKLYYFPVIFGYVMGGIPIVFNQPLTNDHLFSWVSYLISPYEQIKNFVHWNYFIEFYDYSVIGYLPFESGVEPSHAFNVFLLSAYKSAGSQASIGFASFQSSALAEQLGFQTANQLRLYTSLNGQPSLLSSLTLHKTVKSNDVVKWVQQNMQSFTHKGVHQLNLEEEELGGKSEMLFLKLNSSMSTVVLFSENYGLPYFTESHNTLRQIAKSFHNCNPNHQTTTSMNSLKEYLEEAKVSCFLQHNKNKKIVDCCTSLHTQHICNRVSQKTDEEQRDHSTQQCLLVDKIVDPELFRRKCCLYYSSNHRRNISSQPFQFSLSWKVKQSCRLLRLMSKTQSSGFLKSFMASEEASETPHTSDHSSKEYNQLVKEKVASQKFNNKPLAGDRSVMVSSTADIKRSNLTSNIVEGLSCKTNKTINFLMIEKRFAHYFIRLWGGTDDSYNSEDSLAIVSNQDEKIYWMEEKINKTNVDSFLHKHIVGEMAEKLPSDSGLSEHNLTVASSMSIIKRLNASSFTSQIVKKQNPFDSLVFFMGGRRWHGPSHVLSYILHSTKHYFKQFDSLIHFYCLDASKESLPWQYTFDSLPALVFFPAYRPMENSLFPRDLPPTIPNLMAFLLSRVQPELRFRLAISGCTYQCLKNNLFQVSQFQHNMEEDVRSLMRLIRRHYSPLMKSQFRILIRRRFVQKRAAVHLQKMLELFEQSKHKALDKAIEDTLLSDFLFLKWLVTNRLGLTFKT